MEWLIITAGVLLVLYALLDIFLTVLYSRNGKGVMAPYLNQVMWAIFRGIARLFHGKRDAILSFAGPAILVALATAWALLYLVGFALICWPELGSAIKASKGPTPTDFTTALYYSGYALTTLGTGDLVPQTALYRLLMILEAAFGFSFFTLIITYILSIYDAIRQRNTFALMLHHKTDGTGDAKIFITKMGAGGGMSEAVSQLSKVSGYIASIIEMHRFYPILYYFRFKRAYYAMPRTAMVALDTVSLIRSALDPETYRSVVRSVAVAELSTATTHLIETLAEGFSIHPDRLEAAAPDEWADQWRRHYHDLIRTLSEEGIQTAPDPEAGVDDYIASRKKWHPYIEALAESMLYETDTVIKTPSV